MCASLLAKALLAALLARPALAGTNKFGKKFLEKNAKKKGVITLPSGLQYKVLRTGNGSDSPLVHTPCEMHHEGRMARDFPSGPTFDSSYTQFKPPQMMSGQGTWEKTTVAPTFVPDEVIGGWKEAMLLMVEGDEWEIYVPSELGYGDNGKVSSGFGKAEVLVFSLELVKIKGKKSPAIRCDVRTLEKCSGQEKTYIKKHIGMGQERITVELEGLEGMKRSQMKKDELWWLRARVHICMELLKIKGFRCHVKTLKGCSDKEKEYIQRHIGMGQESIAAELKRLEGMKGGKMNEEKLKWLSARVYILGRLKDEL